MNWSPDELPHRWRLCAIGDVATVVGGGTPKTSVAGNFSDIDGHPWITPADLTGYTAKYIGRGRRFLTDQGLASSSAKTLPAGSVLFSTRAPIGYVAIAEQPVATNQGFRSFIPGDEIDSEFLYYALKILRPLAEQLASGTTFSELSGSKAAKLPIVVPPVWEQRLICQALEYATERTASASTHVEAARVRLERFRGTVLAAACSGRLTRDWRDEHPDAVSVEHLAERRGRATKRVSREQAVELELPMLPASYRVGAIGDAATLIQYGTSQRAGSVGGGGVIPVLRMGNIQDGRVDLTDLKYIAVDREIQGLLLEDGDLLFNRTNSSELVGKSAVYRGDTPTTFASYLIRVRLDPKVADPEFVSYWLNSAWGGAWARLAKTDGVSQSNINGSKLALMPLPLPPVEEQRLIVERAGRLLATADRVGQQLESVERKVERSAHGVLAKAFRGELVDSAESSTTLGAGAGV